MDIAGLNGIRAPSIERASERCTLRRGPAIESGGATMSRARFSTTARIAGVVSFCIAAAVGAQTRTPEAASVTKATPPSSSQSKAATSSSQSSMGATNLSSGDRKFIEKAAEGGMAEVQLGKLATQKAGTDQVKQFGQRMVDDHSKANDQLKQVASSKNVTLPTDVDKSTKREMDKLSKLSGADFDREYMKNMVSDHKKDVSDFKSEASRAKDPDVKQFAASTLPTLQEHLQLAQSAQQTANSEPRNTKTSSRASTNKTGT
jgi:putative membrane protein